jgi:creatinine amidohydrolase
MSEEIFLERMTSPEIAARLAAGWKAVVVPCGAVEQHGPHLPLCVDAEHGTRLGQEVALRMGKALVAPTIRVGCSEHHMAFPGTLSLEPETFFGVCRDYCTSLARHGFERVCLLPTHGGNFRPLAENLEDLNAAAGPACTVIAYTDLVGVLDSWKRSVESEAGLGERVGGHADIAESSVMLSLHPDLVRSELAERGYLPEMDEDVIDRIIEEGFDSVTPNGILGDARGLSEPIGTRCIAELADLVAASFGA